MLSKDHSFVGSGLAGLAVLFVACGSGGPRIDPLENRVAAVGSAFVIELKASNDSGADISFGYDTNANVGERGSLNQRPGGGAVFTWTPSAQDIGTWTFDFHALDAGGKSTESITVDVKSAIGVASLPVFRRPLGAGTTLDLDERDCVEIEVLVEDQDSVSVDLLQVEPAIAGAELVSSGDNAAIWRWCPTPEQAAARDRYLLTLAADDGENPQALKHYQVILRHGIGEACRGNKPQIEHTPEEHATAEDIALEARILDPSGLKAPPLLYWSETPISDPPDLTTMVQVAMTMESGDARDGVWRAVVPNLAVADPDGATRDVYYAIIADDNDDKGGTCDHVAVEVYSATITAPPQPSGLEICEPCTVSSQCGSEGDLCLPTNTADEFFCFLACDDATPCPQGYECSAEQLRGVGGAMGRQCIPHSGSCILPDCAEDALEPNASLENATPVTAFGDEELSPPLVLCPESGGLADEDWFEIKTDEEGFVNFYLQGPADDAEVDLSLYDEEGVLLAKSENWGPSDNTGRCLPPGTYYAQVYSYFNRVHPYSIGYQFEEQSCQMSICEDDLFEDDDDLVYGRVADLSEGYHSTDNRICAHDEDWFFLFLEEGQTAYVRLDFAQTSAFDDLDVLFYNGNTDEYLTPCSDDDPIGCDPQNGQSGDSDEFLTWTVEETGYYYAVVRGFQGSSNSYDICIATEEGVCESPR